MIDYREVHVVADEQDPIDMLEGRRVQIDEQVSDGVDNQGHRDVSAGLGGGMRANRKDAEAEDDASARHRECGIEHRQVPFHQG